MKAALAASNDDLDAALLELQRRGLLAASKKAGRAAVEGLVGVACSDEAAVLVEINAETDFVVRSPRFQARSARCNFAFGTLWCSLLAVAPLSTRFFLLGCLLIAVNAQELVGVAAHAALALDVTRFGSDWCGARSCFTPSSTAHRPFLPASTRCRWIYCWCVAASFPALLAPTRIIQAQRVAGSGELSAAVSSVAAEVRENVRLRRASWCDFCWQRGAISALTGATHAG